MTEILPADPSGISRAATLLQQGALVSLPTETVYGLGADARNGTAVAGIYEAKGRPSFNPLIIHVADVDQARRYGRWSDTAEILASAFWPGPPTSRSTMWRAYRFSSVSENRPGLAAAASCDAGSSPPPPALARRCDRTQL